MNSELHHEQRHKPSGTISLDSEALEKVLRRIRRTKDFPSVSKYVVEINQKLSEPTNQTSASELANVILKDYALTNKLLKLVNSAFYGFVSGKVTTVTRAVVLLGYDNVRLAALSLLLFEHFKGQSGVKDLKDATISSFWAGLIAKEVATLQGMNDPEEAFICALLNHLGKLMIIYHLPKEYQQIKSVLSQQGKDQVQAVKQVLGISYKELGMAVARQWNFPESIFKTMVPLSSAALEEKGLPLDPLCVVANFSNDLGRIIDTIPLKQRPSALKKLLGRYHHYITVSEDKLKALMDACLEKLYMHADALQFSVEDSAFILRLCGQDFKSPEPANTHCCDLPVDPCPDEGQVFRLSSYDECDTSAPLSEGEDAVSILMGGIQEVSNAMMGDHDINDIALMSLEVIYRALHCRRALLFIHDSRTNFMEARYGYGADIQRLQGSLKFDAKVDPDTDLFSRALRSGKDLIVEDTCSSELQALIPSWYHHNIDAKAFIFLPVAYQKVCVGAYYADLDVAGPPINTLEHKYLSMLRNQLVLGIKMGR